MSASAKAEGTRAAGALLGTVLGALAPVHIRCVTGPCLPGSQGSRPPWLFGLSPGQSGPDLWLLLPVLTASVSSRPLHPDMLCLVCVSPSGST